MQNCNVLKFYIWDHIYMISKSFNQAQSLQSPIDPKKKKKKS